MYRAGRNSQEGTHGVAKDEAQESLGAPGRRRKRGLAAQSLYAAISLAVVARGLAVTMLPDLALPDHHSGVKLRDIAERQLHRAIFAATRSTDAARPSTQALLAAVREAAAPLRRDYGV